MNPTTEVDGFYNMPIRNLPNGLRSRRYHTYCRKSFSGLRTRTINTQRFALPITAGKQISLVFSPNKSVQSPPRSSTQILKDAHKAINEQQFLEASDLGRADFAVSIIQ